MNRIFAIFFTGIIFSFSGKAQNNSVSEEIRFVSYLIDNSEYRDALFILSRLNSSSQNSGQLQIDSLNYFSGWAYYSVKNLDSSAFFFEKVSDESPFFFKSKFYESFDKIFLGKYDEAKSILNDLSLQTDTDLQKLKIFELAGIALLQRDYQKFNELSRVFDFNYYPLAKEQENFNEDVKKLQAIKFKSAFLAGLFSAIIPGAGKFYAGYRGLAISALLPSAMLAAVALESFLKLGLLSPQFIIFGGMFSVFYFGNIWGSALSTKTKRDEQFYEIDQDILLDLHLPLRRVFN